MADNRYAPSQDSGDLDSLGGRVRRYARVGSAVGSAAARLAGGRLFGVPLDNLEHAVELRQALGGLKGPLMKVAQILSTIPDVLPEEYTTEFAQLQTNAPSMGWAFVKRRMTTELGPDWQSRFASFERIATAAASLGQVHRARSHDGRSLACKLQYPDMTSAVEADLRQLKLIFSIYRRYDRAINPSEIHAELSERLREELDYEREGRHMMFYRHMLAEEAGVAVPEPLPELSSRRLLTMTWLEGERLLSFVDSHAELRNTLARNMFTAWYTPFYNFGVIHGDPHLGNYTARPGGSINLLDFGCIRVFKPSFVRAVIDLYWALHNDDEDLAVHAYETWGFKNVSREVMEILNHWARFLYRPLMDDRARLIQDDDGVMYGARVAGRIHSELRRLGGVTPPREFVLMDRAAIGLGGVFTRLKAEVNWHQLFHGMIQGFDEAALQERQRRALQQFDLPLPI
ncbi:MAG: AarF/ABC1/UbiB kinase family protein [Rhodospirillales bacterium]|nr:AarF/ABC1/UbiB kinase family protein [Rhodospirillales bacterium]